MRNAILHDDGQLKLGLFGANCSSGRTYTNAPERWDPTWANNVALARMADDAGIEAMIPIARWKGYGGETNPNGTSWESITWAAGLLAATVAHQRVRDGACAAQPSRRRGEADGDGGPHRRRALRRQRRVRLERGRVPDVRRHEAGARGPLRPGQRVVADRQPHLGRRSALRLRRRPLQAAPRRGLSAPLRRRGCRS